MFSFNPASGEARLEPYLRDAPRPSRLLAVGRTAGVSGLGISRIFRPLLTDLAAGVAGRPEYGKVVLFGPLVNLGVMAVMFTGFLVIGTAFFVRRETNR